jgi:ribosomal protein L6P/L9E
MTMAASGERRERAIQKLIARFGEFKRVVRMRTGVAYKVPTRDIIVKGIREQDLDQYPKWVEEKK